MSRQEKVAIFFLGRPASGKGTQAKLLAERLGFYHFTTSREAKEYIRTHDDEQTQRQMKLYKAGFLLEPEWVAQVVLERSKEIMETWQGIIFDGSPRTLYEAKTVFPAVMELFGKENVFVFLIEISEEECKIRVEKRLICNQDSRHVFIRTDSLVPGSPCPEGDGVLEIRDLDNLEVVKTRTEEYANKTLPGIKFIDELHSIAKINGERSVEKIHQDILRVIGL